MNLQQQQEYDNANINIHIYIYIYMRVIITVLELKYIRNRSHIINGQSGNRLLYENIAIRSPKQ